MATSQQRRHSDTSTLRLIYTAAQFDLMPMETTGETAIATFLNHYNLELHYKCLFLYPQVSVLTLFIKEAHFLVAEELYKKLNLVKMQRTMTLMQYFVF